LVTIGDYGFYDCESVITFNLPSLETAGVECFDYCYAVTGFSFPSLVTAKEYCFYDCESATTFDLPLLENIGDYCFDSCYSASTFNLPSCVNLGTTTGYNFVFDNITGRNIDLTIPSSLLTCDGGNPDGDIISLQANNTVTITTV
jgi:hypothetical protein